MFGFSTPKLERSNKFKHRWLVTRGLSDQYYWRVYLSQVNPQRHLLAKWVINLGQGFDFRSGLKMEQVNVWKHFPISLFSSWFGVTFFVRTLYKKCIIACFSAKILWLLVTLNLSNNSRVIFVKSHPNLSDYFRPFNLSIILCISPKQESLLRMTAKICPRTKCR